MKKIFMPFALAATVFCFAACSEKDPVIPPTPGGDDDGDDPKEEVDGTHEKTAKVNVDFIVGSDYANAQMPGSEILEFFDMTEAEFYAAMGTYSGSAADGTTAQENNTISFGLAVGNDHENLTMTPSTCNNFGHWVGTDAQLTYWNGREEKGWVVAAESQATWGAESPDEETLSAMFNFGIYDGASHEAGTSEVFTEFFYYTDPDTDAEYLFYVEWHINFVEAGEVELTIAGEQTITRDVEYNGDYAGFSIDEDIDAEALESAIGIAAADATVYAINSDGSVYAIPGTNFWYSIAGDVMSWGEGCGIDINKDAGYWGFCMYPDASLAGQTCVGAIAFANPDNMKAYKVTVKANIAGIEAVVPEDESKMHDVTVDAEFNVTSSDGCTVDLSEKLADAFQITAEQFATAVTAGQVECSAYVGEDAVEQSGGGLMGCWFDANGAWCEYGTADDAGNNIRSYFAEFYNNYTAGVGFYESDMAGVNGKTIDTFKIVVKYTAATVTVTATINYKISFAIAAE